jgi:hypothetical protein
MLAVVGRAEPIGVERRYKSSHKWVKIALTKAGAILHSINEDT